MIGLALAWAGLVLLLVVEVVAAALHVGWLAWIAAPVMIATVALAFMHAGQASGLSRIFAAAGLFWVVVLLTLGSTDYVARHQSQMSRAGISAGTRPASLPPGG